MLVSGSPDPGPTASDSGRGRSGSIQMTFDAEAEAGGAEPAQLGQRGQHGHTGDVANKRGSVAGEHAARQSRWQLHIFLCTAYGRSGKRRHAPGMTRTHDRRIRNPKSARPRNEPKSFGQRSLREIRRIVPRLRGYRKGYTPDNRDVAVHLSGPPGGERTPDHPRDCRGRKCERLTGAPVATEASALPRDDVTDRQHLGIGPRKTAVASRSADAMT